MDSVELKRRLRAGTPVFGTWSHLPLLQVVEVIGACGMDFIVFDLEHGPHSLERMPALYCAAEAQGMAPLTRVAGLETGAVLRSLDSGARGIVVPHVDSREKAHRALASMYYGDDPGNRGVATLTRASLFGCTDEATHRAAQNAATVSCLMVEEAGGLQAIEEIAALPGLDVVFVGIYDLAQALAMPCDLGDARFAAVVRDAVERITAAGAAAGCYAADARAVEPLLELGVRFITVNVDGGILRGAYHDLCRQLERLR